MQEKIVNIDIQTELSLIKYDNGAKYCYLEHNCKYSQEYDVCIELTKENAIQMIELLQNFVDN